jgi:hypothetical protein
MILKLCTQAVINHYVLLLGKNLVQVIKKVFLLLGHYAVYVGSCLLRWDWQAVPKFWSTTNICYITTHKSEDLIYTSAEA